MRKTGALLIEELDAEVMDLLPSKETLCCFEINISPIIALNLSMAINAGSVDSVADSEAVQELLVMQE